MEIQHDQDLMDVLQKQKGKRVTLTLQSGHSINGIVSRITDRNLVHLTFVGQEFKGGWGMTSAPADQNWDAVIPFASISGFLMYVRKWKETHIEKKWVDKDGYECTSTDVEGAWITVEYKDGEYHEVGEEKGKE
jgi:hypothetical protein